MQTEAQRDAASKAKIWIMGTPFRPMVKRDFDAHAGATETDLIGFPSPDVTLIYSPDSRELAEIWDGGERVWKVIADL